MWVIPRTQYEALPFIMKIPAIRHDYSAVLSQYNLLDIVSPYHLLIKLVLHRYHSLESLIDKVAPDLITST